MFVLFFFFNVFCKGSNEEIFCLLPPPPAMYLNMKQIVSDTMKRIIPKLVLLLAEDSARWKEGGSGVAWGKEVEEGRTENGL